MAQPLRHLFTRFSKMNKGNLKSILVITVGFTILGFFSKTDWPFYVAIAVGLAAIISNRAAELINKIWFGLAKILGYVNSRILLTIIYYLFLLPMALLSRLSKNKTIILKQQGSSYYAERNHQFEKADFENPW